MATTTNAGIVYPVVGNTITPLATHFANLANSVDTMYVGLRDGNARLVGTNAQRIAVTGAILREGLEFYTTDTNLNWFYNGSAWLLTPGQVLATSFLAPAGNTTTANTQLGNLATTPALPSGQAILIETGPIGVFSTTAGGIQVQLRWRTDGTAVTYNTGSFRDSRGYSPGSSTVVSAPGQMTRDVTATATSTSAGLFLITGITGFGTYGIDGYYIKITSA